jgi:hypothetical protein
MKKIIILVTMLICNFVSAQQEFTRNYTKYIEKTESGVLSEWKDLELLAVFHEKGTQYVVFYFPNASVKFRINSDITEGETTSGDQFQSFTAYEITSGGEITFQLFDKALRLIFFDNTSMEYHN